MKKINPTFERYKKAIVLIENSNLEDITNIIQGIELSRECLSQFSASVRISNFPSDEEEITFFKHQKPYVEGRLQYFKKLHHFLLEKPVSGIAKQRKFINFELKKLDTQKCKQLEFVKYYRLGINKFDSDYFLRKNNHIELIIDRSHHFKDPAFSTSHDFLVSKIVKIDLLINFFTKELESIKKKGSNNNIVKEVKPEVIENLPWTGTKTELVELLFALIASGSIRNGNVDIKKIVKVSEELFKIDLGNINKTFEQIKSRKKDSTKFLDKLTISLNDEIALEA